ncbi:MAG TPA: glycoside hydrolase [Cytophagales bacterium]|nr:glycoside hydrolase [Cytophagales bacterium]
MRQFLLLLLLAGSVSVLGQTVLKQSFQELEYRSIGPFRASRTVGAVGIPSQPNVFFMGVNNGGVWKSDDYGRTWNPIFDDQPTGSVGDIAVSPTNPNIIYVGSGEGLHRPDLSVGDGIFKSVDGGKTWSHVGLNDVQQVGRIIVHPTNPDIVFVAGLGHPYGANEMRGVFRTTNGGKSWEKVFYINHNTGAIQIEFDPTNPQVLYADMWEHQEGPWENAAFAGPNSGLYKSTDGGTTWRQLTNGLPGAAQGLGRIGFGIANSNSKRLYATVDARQNGGIYRSDDAGENWSLVTTDRRIWGRGGDFAEIKVHPKNPDIVFAGNVAAYKSTDGGKTWWSFKGAPGGDDYHRLWINPEHPDIMFFAVDQGATISVNGGKTWSTWLNQPTSQMYHVITDNQFPYWVYGGQQESGAIGTASRGDGGQISMRDWIGIGNDEYATIAPDPKNPDIIYGGRVMRFNKKTGQSQNVAPEAFRTGKYRMLRTLPLLFHPKDPNMLLFGTNVLWKTMNGGQEWEIISPDLTRKQPEVPASVGDFKTAEMETMKQRAVIYAVSASPLEVNTIWAGTDDGLVHLTKDGGKSWKEVTPPALKSWDKVSIMDAGHFDVNTAYMAINAIRKDDMKPHVYRTHDGGVTWQEIVKGMNPMGPVNVVREDPKQKGLLFAGTEREVYFSIDDGESWQSLRMNMPATSIRDLVIHEDDLVIGTHGRSIWIMDNINPLREQAKAAATDQAYLFGPPVAIRVRDNMFLDTPILPEEPTGKNPPDGAILDYLLKQNASDVVLEIVAADGQVVRKYSSKDKPEVLDTTAMQYPTYWFRPAQKIATDAGHHRFIWDLRYAPPAGSQRQHSISAVYKNTPTGPQGPFVMPGKYTVRLTVDGKPMEKSLEIKMDPRVTITSADLKAQHDYSMDCYNAYHELQSMRESIEAQLNGKKKLKKSQYIALNEMVGEGKPENPDIIYGSITERPNETIVGLQDKFLYMQLVFQNADAKPTQQAIEGLKRLQAIKIEMEKKRAELR